MKNKITIATLLFLLFAGGFSVAWGQPATPVRDSLRHIDAAVYFRIGESCIDPEFEGNKYRLLIFNDALQKVLSDSDYVVSRIVVVGTSSPDGRLSVNDSLAGRRAKALAVYLKEQLLLPADKIEVVNGGENWEGLRRMMEASEELPCKEEMLQLVSIPDQKVRKLRMMYYADSKPWLWMYEHFFAQLRIGAGDAKGYPTLNGSHVTCSYELRAEAKARIADSLAAQHSVVDTLSHSTQVPGTPSENTSSSASCRASEGRIRKPDPKRAMIALKTNLLFDVVTAVNLGVEIPLGRRWSLSAEGVFPQWNFNNRTSVMLTEFSIEPRFWLGNHETLRLGNKRNALTGHFIGLYGNYVDNYDLQWKHRGVMGRGYGVGLTYGYTHRLSRSFNMEYSVGLGALYLENKSYDVSDDYGYKVLREERSGWHILPTRARVSLVWLIGTTGNKTK